MIIKEDFLHWLWKFKKYDWRNLRTTAGEAVILQHPGQHNYHAGPDFFNARVEIAGQLWAGNVEIHIKASDWYAHTHEQDEAYKNVILHVVWEHEDVAVYNAADQQIPTVVLKDYVARDLMTGYQRLFFRQNKTFINCEKDIAHIPDRVLSPWLDRIYLERLERKVGIIDRLLNETANDWEAVMFILLARNFGTKVNADAFETLAKSIPFTVVRKLANQPGTLEAFLLGHAQLLPPLGLEEQVKNWSSTYEYHQKKFNVPVYVGPSVQFFKLRPANFPTIRLSQLARLYEKQKGLFAEVISLKTIPEFYELFSLKTSEYWETHYNFGKTHTKRSKKLSKAFVELVLINTIVPLKFAYARYQGGEVTDTVFELMQGLPAERNRILKNFYKLRDWPANAWATQALLQLKSQYCDPNRCLHCAAGNFLLSKSQGLS